MKFFYLCSTPNLDKQFMVHERDCPNLSPIDDRKYLGPFNSASEARRSISLSNGNIYVCSICGCGYEVYTIKQGHIESDGLLV